MPPCPHLLAGAAAAVAPAAALAHPGHHEPSALEGLQHVLSQPDHLLALGVLALLVFAGGGWRLLRTRARARR